MDRGWHSNIRNTGNIVVMNPLEFVFKRIDKLELKLDVYLPVDAAPEKPASACVWWHGGGRKSRLTCATRNRQYSSVSGVSVLTTVYDT